MEAEPVEGLKIWRHSVILGLLMEFTSTRPLEISKKILRAKLKPFFTLHLKHKVRRKAWESFVKEVQTGRSPSDPFRKMYFYRLEVGRKGCTSVVLALKISSHDFAHAFNLTLYYK